MSVTLRHEGPIAVITLNRPEVLNALSFEVVREIGDAIDQVSKSDARVLVFTGTGDRAFSAGADIKELMGRDMAAQLADTERGQHTFAKLDDLRIPSIAVIHGFALGGGLELAMACTFRVATPKAKLGLPEIKLGVLPGYGGTQRLPRLVGPARATEIILSGRMLDATEAERIGLVTWIVEGTDPAAIGLEVANRFATTSLSASFIARQAIRRGFEVSFEEGLRIEADSLTLAFNTEDAREGMSAFLEKRPAKFR